MLENAQTNTVKNIIYKEAAMCTMCTICIDTHCPYDEDLYGNDNSYGTNN